LHRKGYASAYTLRVAVRIANRAFADFVERHGAPRTPDAEDRCQAAGGVVVGLGERTAEMMPEGRWPGHTVVIVPGLTGEGPLICDATVTQANRPGTKIELPPFVAIVSDAFVRGQRPFQKVINGCHLSYRALPGDREHEATELWQSRVGIDRVADMAMRRLASG
jgi:hypothetical protein